MKVKLATAFTKVRSTRTCCVGCFVNIYVIGIHEKMLHCSQEKLISQKQYTVTQTLDPLSVNCPNENHRKTEKTKQTT